MGVHTLGPCCTPPAFGHTVGNKELPDVTGLTPTTLRADAAPNSTSSANSVWAKVVGART